MNMVRIVEENGGLASKQLAEAAWRAWPRLSPDFWRESLGETVGKVWVLGGGADDIRMMGVNGWYGRAVAAFDGGVVVREVIELVEMDGCAGESLMWRVPEGVTADSDVAAAMLTAFEEAVRGGAIPYYGLAGVRGLGAWQAAAVRVAEQVWGRKKRAGLRQVVVRAQPYSLGAWLEESTEHVKGGQREAVSDVELAVRLGWRVLVEGGLDWQVPQVGLVQIGLEVDGAAWRAAEALLHEVVEAEAALNARLGGWPMQEGRMAWSALAAVSAGEPVWPTREVWRRWCAEVLPALLLVWERVEGTEVYRDLLAKLGGEVGAALAAGGEIQVGRVLVQPLRQRMGEAWAGADDVTVVLGVLASLPGVHGVLVVPELLSEERVRGLQARPDVADVFDTLQS